MISCPCIESQCPQRLCRPLKTVTQEAEGHRGSWVRRRAWPALCAVRCALTFSGPSEMGLVSPSHGPQVEGAGSRPGVMVTCLFCRGGTRAQRSPSRTLCPEPVPFALPCLGFTLDSTPVSIIWGRTPPVARWKSGGLRVQGAQDFLCPVAPTHPRGHPWGPGGQAQGGGTLAGSTEASEAT